MKELKACPFCGESTEIEELRIHAGLEIVDYFELSCSNPDCPVAVIIEGYDKEYLIHHWNIRSEPRSEAPKEASIG